MTDNKGMTAITDKIQAEAQGWSDEHIATAKSEADAITADFEAQSKAAFDSAVSEANAKVKAISERAVSQGEMDRRKMLLAARQECVAGAFERALELLRTLPDEEKILLMVKNAVRYQTADAQYIFNAADRESTGKRVVEVVNSLFKKQQLKETFSGGFMEQLKKLFTAPGALTATLSEKTGDFAGGFIIKQGDIEINCTFEVLVGGVRENLEGEAASILFSQGGGG